MRRRSSDRDDGMLPNDYVLEDYRILGVLGVGGFGVTYVAHDDTLQERVAIKEFLPAGVAEHIDCVVEPVSASLAEKYTRLLSDFISESRNLARVRHHHIVRVRRCFKRNGTAYMVMDYEDGEDFRHHLEHLGHPPTEAELLRVVPPLLDGLQAIHNAGLIHRDLKPQNIFIRRSDGSPVLLDFGAARSESASHFTAILTAGYAPIEQYEEDANQGPWTDIYGLAAVLYRAITGAKPPAALNRLATDRLAPLALICRGRYSEPFLRGIDRGLTLLPENRPRTIAEWRSDWLAPPAAPIAVKRPAAAPPPPPTPPPPRAAVEEDTTERSDTPKPAPPPSPVDHGDDEVDESVEISEPPEWSPPPPRIVVIPPPAPEDDEEERRARRFDVIRPSIAILTMLVVASFIEMTIGTVILNTLIRGNRLTGVALATLLTFALTLGTAMASREVNPWSAAVWSAAATVVSALAFVIVFARYLV